jgi:hypothetical protein
MIRKDCLDHLETWFDPATKAADVEWLRGYDSEPFFHFSAGMAIRNRLRDQFTDMELPVIETNMAGEPYNAQNWDDYYTGAIDEFLERYPK